MAVRLTVKAPNARLVSKGLQDLGAEIPKIGKLQIYRAMLRARTRLRKPGSRITYPVRWDSEKQKRAFFATDGFGRGIPARRSGRYPRGWNIVATATGYRLENNAIHARYVGGDFSGAGQSRIHQSRWPIFQQVIEDEVQGLPPEIEKHISYRARQKGF